MLSAFAVEKPGRNVQITPICAQFECSNAERFAPTGKLLSRRGGAELSFVHDPNKGRAGEGTIVKSFKLARMNTDNGRSE